MNKLEVRFENALDEASSASASEHDLVAATPREPGIDIET